MFFLNICLFVLFVCVVVAAVVVVFPLVFFHSEFESGFNERFRYHQQHFVLQINLIDAYQTLMTGKFSNWMILQRLNQSIQRSCWSSS